MGVGLLDEALAAVSAYVDPHTRIGIVKTWMGTFEIEAFRLKIPITMKNVDNDDDGSPLARIHAPPFVRASIGDYGVAEFGIGAANEWSGDPAVRFYPVDPEAERGLRQIGYLSFQSYNKLESVAALLCILWANGHQEAKEPLQKIIFYGMNHAAQIETGTVDLAGVEAVVDRCHKTLIIDDPRLVNRHVLLAGPPGCGKSEIVKELITRTPGWVHYPLDAGVENWGQFMSSLNRVMRFLSEGSPEKVRMMIVADEIDEIGLSREKDTKLVYSLLRVLDGVSDLGFVKFVATTNRPMDLDPALLRIGRFGPMIVMDTPDETTFHAIAEFYANRYDAAVDIGRIAANRDGAVGCDIRAAFENCIIAEIEITTENVIKELHNVLACKKAECVNYM
jgi:hypothetical protein